MSCEIGPSYKLSVKSEKYLSVFSVYPSGFFCVISAEPCDSFLRVISKQILGIVPLIPLLPLFSVRSFWSVWCFPFNLKGRSCPRYF